MMTQLVFETNVVSHKAVVDAFCELRGIENQQEKN